MYIVGNVICLIGEIVRLIGKIIRLIEKNICLIGKDKSVLGKRRGGVLGGARRAAVRPQPPLIGQREGVTAFLKSVFL